MEIRCDNPNCRRLLLKVSGDFTGRVETVCPRCGRTKEHERRISAIDLLVTRKPQLKVGR